MLVPFRVDANRHDHVAFAEWEAIDVGDQQVDALMLWACEKKSNSYKEELTQEEHHASDRMVATLLKECGYSLQANRKTREGCSHPDRNAQFEYINSEVTRFLKRGRPAISVDTKKKGLTRADCRLPA